MSAATATIAILGAGPAGLIAADRLCEAGFGVTLYDRMPSAGRKLLMAGRGGLNLTHAEPLPAFVARYGDAAPRLRPLIESFPPQALRAWCESLGEPTFVGSSGRVFPRSLKASPLLRSLLRRLAARGARVEWRRRWVGWDDRGRPLLADDAGFVQAIDPDATLLALGGGSWPRLGSDGSWAETMSSAGIKFHPLQPANCGLAVTWSTLFEERFAGQPLKRIRVVHDGMVAAGDAVVTTYGIEGGPFYALVPGVRAGLAGGAVVTVVVDLRPDLTCEQVAERLAQGRPGQSTAELLRRCAGLPSVAAHLLREARGPTLPRDPAVLASAIKALPLRVTGLQPLARAISTAGGIAWDEIDDGLMLRCRPGTFVAGEMLDWEAPTGGYLLQACFATGWAAAGGIIDRLAPSGRQPEPAP